MPVLRQTLGRFCFFCTSRSFRTSTIASARGRRTQYTNEFDEAELASEFPEPSRTNFAAARQPRAFDMGRFTDAVRGDLDADEERRHFKEQKPVWLKEQAHDRRRQQPVETEQEHEIAWPEDPRKAKPTEELPKDVRKKKTHKAIYRPRDDVEEEDERGLSGMQSSGGNFTKRELKHARAQERNDEVESSGYSPSNTDGNNPSASKQQSKNATQGYRPTKNDDFDVAHTGNEPADRRKFRDRVQRGEVTEENHSRERKSFKKMTKEEYVNTERNKQFNDFRPNDDDEIEVNYGKPNRKTTNPEKVQRKFSAPEKEARDDEIRYSQDPNGPNVSASGGSFSGLRVLKDNDKTFKQAVMDVRNRKNRMKNRKILLEGVRLINDALESGLQLHTVYTCSPELLRRLSSEALKLSQPELFQVSQKQMTFWSEMTTAPGIMAIADMPDATNFQQTDSMPLTVVLDNIREPGNMGAVIRVLAGAGCEQLIATENCTDPWDSKVLRAASGGHFHVPIQYNVPWDMVENYLPDDASVFLADNVESADSFNTGSAVRGRSRTSRQNVELDTAMYHQVDMGSGNVVLVIGGETHGISPNAYALTNEHKGVRLVIPMGNNVDSLNAASAVAVLAFEMKRQRLMVEDADGVSDDHREEQPSITASSN